MEQNRVPDSFVPIKAWRLFCYDEAGYIRSYALTHHIWKSASPIPAMCNEMSYGMFQQAYGRHKSPDFHCSCGYYVYKEKARAIAEFQLQVRSRMLNSGFGGDVRLHPILAGEVEIWGKIVEHDIGYRAEHIKIKILLFNWKTTIGEALRISDRYEVPFDVIQESESWLISENRSEKSTSNPSPSLNPNPYQASNTSLYQITYQSLNPSPIARPSDKLVKEIMNNPYFITPQELTEAWRKGAISKKEYKDLLQLIHNLKGGK